MSCQEITALGYFVLTAVVFLTTIVKISHGPQYLQPIKHHTLSFDNALNFESIVNSKINSKINKNHFKKYKFQKTAPENQNPNIFFLKTHKTGSSTVQNILFRYAQNYNRTIVWPKGNMLFFNYSNKFSVDSANRNTLGNSVVLHHLRYSSDVKYVFETQSSKSEDPPVFRFTILREPETLIPSVYSYYGFGTDFDAFLNNLNNSNKASLRNGQLFDLGFPDYNGDQITKVEMAIDLVEKRFDFVMILERFDECLMILKKFYFPWLKLVDLVYFVKNAQVKVEENINSSNATNLKSATLRKWAIGDQRLYNHFSKMLDLKIAEYGSNELAADLLVFRDLNKKISEKCFTGNFLEAKSGSKIARDHQVWVSENSSIKIPVIRDSERTDELCLNLQRSEMSFHNKLHP